MEETHPVAAIVTSMNLDTGVQQLLMDFFDSLQKTKTQISTFFQYFGYSTEAVDSTSFTNVENRLTTLESPVNKVLASNSYGISINFLTLTSSGGMNSTLGGINPNGGHVMWYITTLQGEGVPYAERWLHIFPFSSTTFSTFMWKSTVAGLCQVDIVMDVAWPNLKTPGVDGIDAIVCELKPTNVDGTNATATAQVLDARTIRVSTYNPDTNDRVWEGSIRVALVNDVH